MYRLIIELPFDIVGVWYQLFKDEKSANEKLDRLPYGLSVIEDSKLQEIVGDCILMVLPFDKELENDA